MARKNMIASSEQRTFEVATSRFQTIVGLTAVQSVDILGALNQIENTGAQYCRKDAKALADVATWMVTAVEETDRLNEENRVQPPLTDDEVFNLQTLRNTYLKYAPDWVAEEKPTEPSQPERTSDAKA